MKNLTQLLIIACFGSMLVFTTHAQTTIQGGEVGGVWTRDGSPYQVLGDLLVPDSVTLTIEPGVDVIFMGHYRINVKGRLLAVGEISPVGCTINHPWQCDTLAITFTAADTLEGWHGLRFEDIAIHNDSSRLVYCKFMHGIHDYVAGQGHTAGALSIVNVDKLEIRHCLFIRNKLRGTISTAGGAIGLINADPMIVQNLFTGNAAEGAHGGAIAITEASNPVFINNIVVANSAYGGGGLLIHRSDPVLINNTIIDNTADHGGGIDMQFSTPSFINCIIYGNDAENEGDQIHTFSDELPDFLMNFIHCVVEGGRADFAQNHFDNGCPACDGRFENVVDEDSSLHELAAGEFRPGEWSTCVNAGISTVEIDDQTYVAPLVDFYGRVRPRPSDSTPDIGAVEQGTTVSIGDLSSIQKMTIHPNPTSDYFNIQLDEAVHGARVEVFDLHGRLLVSSHREALEDETLPMDVAQLMPGAYIVRVAFDDQMYVGRVVIVNE